MRIRFENECLIKHSWMGNVALFTETYENNLGLYAYVVKHLATDLR